MKSPRQGRGVRPLTDQVREALFNILADKTFDSYFLDLFAGTGAVGIEALSRGAKLSIFVELNRQVVGVIRQNLELTGFSDRAEVYAVDVLRAVTLLHNKGAKFDLIFLGAPYDSPLLEKVLVKLSEADLVKPDGLIIAEHRKHCQLAASYGRYEQCRSSRYGETILSFYKEKNENSGLSGQL